jgi:hypothetical protein
MHMDALRATLIAALRAADALLCSHVPSLGGIDLHLLLDKRIEERLRLVPQICFSLAHRDPFPGS